MMKTDRAGQTHKPQSGAGEEPAAPGEVHRSHATGSHRAKFSSPAASRSCAAAAPLSFPTPTTSILTTMPKGDKASYTAKQNVPSSPSKKKL